MPASSAQAPATPARTGPAALLALADRCVQCGLCLPHCPTYQLDRSEAESPRGRITYMKALAAGALAPTVAGDLHVDHCLGCRRCESACPAGVQYGELLVAARTAQFARTRPKGMARIVSTLLARPSLLEWALLLYRGLFRGMPARLRRLPKPPPVQFLPRSTASAVAPAVLRGCVARGYEESTITATTRLLGAIGLELAIPSGQTCCGAAARHQGDVATFKRLSEHNRMAFAGRSRVLCLASGCKDTLSLSLQGQSEVIDPIDMLAAQLPRLRFRGSTRRIALHLPCSQSSGAALRRLLAAIPGLTVLELPEGGCCGAAGLHMLSEPQRAAALRAPLLSALESMAVDELLSANIGCRLHLANACTLPVRHPLDFLAEHLA